MSAVHRDTDVDVCVVGAGPVGLTLAIALRRLSLRVRIVDRAPATKHEARALVVWPRAGEALAGLSVGETLREHAVELRRVSIYGNGRRLGELRTGKGRSAYRYPLNIEQHDIERLLTKELKQLGVSVEWRTEATDVKVHDDRAELTLRTPDGATQVAGASWVVGCEGTASMVRDRLGIAFEGRRRTGMQVLQGNARPTWRLPEEPGHGFFFLAPRRSLMAFPLPGGGFRFFCFLDDPDPGRTEPPTLEDLRELVADTAVLPDLSLALTEPRWLNRARFSDRVAARFRSGRALVAGDAAHAWAPVGGHGMNVGILGAYNLAWKLAAVHRGHASDAVLDTYGDEQRALALGYIREMRFNFLELPLPPLGYRAFTACLPATLAVPGIQRRLDWRMSDLGRNHRESPLSWQRSGRRLRSGARGPRAGDRVPDVLVVTPASRGSNGTPVRLHTLLGYDRWTLLLPAARADARTLRALRAACWRAAARVEILPIAAMDLPSARGLGSPDVLWLVRPDGYIGCVAPLGTTGVLDDYLATFLAPNGSGARRARGNGQSAGRLGVPPGAP